MTKMINNNVTLMTKALRSMMVTALGGGGSGLLWVLAVVRFLLVIVAAVFVVVVSWVFDGISFYIWVRWIC